MPYVIAPLRLVKGENSYESYVDALVALQSAAFKKANEIWEGREAGGLTPSDNQFGLAPFRKNDQASDVTDSTPSGSYSYQRTITAAAWQDLFSYTVRNNTIHAFAGLAFLDPTLRVSQVRIEISDRRLPIWDIQEADLFPGPGYGVLFKTDEGKELIAGPQERVLIRGYGRTVGPQTIKPLGFELYRTNNLVLTET